MWVILIYRASSLPVNPFKQEGAGAAAAAVQS